VDGGVAITTASMEGSEKTAAASLVTVTDEGSTIFASITDISELVTTATSLAASISPNTRA